MSQEEKYARRQIIFDLDTKALEKYYPSKSWRGAYDVLGRYFHKFQFDHVEGTAYASRTEMEAVEVDRMIIKLLQEQPWLHKCMKDCRVSPVERKYSLNHLFDKDANIPTREELEQQKQREPKRQRQKDDGLEL